MYNTEKNSKHFKNIFWQKEKKGSWRTHQKCHLWLHVRLLLCLTVEGFLTSLLISLGHNKALVSHHKVFLVGNLGQGPDGSVTIAQYSYLYFIRMEVTSPIWSIALCIWKAYNCFLVSNNLGFLPNWCTKWIMLHSFL